MFFSTSKITLVPAFLALSLSAQNVFADSAVGPAQSPKINIGKVNAVIAQTLKEVVASEPRITYAEVVFNPRTTRPEIPQGELNAKVGLATTAWAPQTPSQAFFSVKGKMQGLFSRLSLAAGLRTAVIRGFNHFAKIALDTRGSSMNAALKQIVEKFAVAQSLENLLDAFEEYKTYDPHQFDQLKTNVQRGRGGKIVGITFDSDRSTDGFIKGLKYGVSVTYTEIKISLDYQITDTPADTAAGMRESFTKYLTLLSNGSEDELEGIKSMVKGMIEMGKGFIFPQVPGV